MSYASTFVAPSWSPAATPPPLLFLAPELWGEKVAEHRRGGDGPGGTIRWTPIPAQPGAATDAAAAGTAACKDSVDELMWITSCFTPAAATATAEGAGPVILPYPHEEHVKPRAPAGSKPFAWAETAAIVISFALAGYAIVGIPAQQGATPGAITATQAGMLLPTTTEPALSPTVAPPAENLGVASEPTTEPNLEVSSIFPIISMAHGPINSSRLDPPKGAALTETDDDEPKGSSLARPAPRQARRQRRIDPEATAVAAAAHWEAAIAPHLVPEPAAIEQEASSEMVFDRDELVAQSLTRSQIRIALQRVAPLVRNCTDDGPLTTQVGLAISGDQGRVTRVRLGRPLAGTREGDCVTRALRRARFPRFADSSLEISSYPLVVR